jgi:2-oxoglutarate dehydrogenase E1 component
MISEPGRVASPERNGAGGVRPPRKRKSAETRIETQEGPAGPHKVKQMARTDELNDLFASTSFLYGGNAHYIEELYAQYQDNPASLPVEWQTFFGDLHDKPDDVRKNAQGASWERDNWPLTPNGELTSALDGNWADVEAHMGAKLKEKAAATAQPISSDDIVKAQRDSVRAIMMIRAYRMRGHLHADLDPLGICQSRSRTIMSCPPSLRLLGRGLRPQDLHRQRARAGIRDHSRDARHPEADLLLDASAWNSCTSPIRRRSPGSSSASRGRTRASPSPRTARRRSCNKLIEAEGFEKFIDVKYTGTKRFGLDGGESLVPALEQIIKRGGADGREGHRARHGPPRPPQRALPGYGESRTGPSSTSSRAARSRPTTSKAPAT